MIDTLKRLYSTDEGVSSVVGVVLLTGVVVVSVSSAGAFMIQNFEQQSSVQPLSSIQFEESRSFVTDGNRKTYDYTRVKITHQDGEPIPTNELSITVAGSPAYDVTGDVGGSGAVQLADPFEEYGSLLSVGSPSFQVGDSVSIYAAISPDTVAPDRIQQNGAAIVNPPINANNGPGPARLVDDDDNELARGIRLQKGQTVRVVHEPTEAVIAEHTISSEQKPWDGTDDSDGDGVSDKEEGNRDEDGDGTSDFADSDTDGDGVPDHIEGDDDADNDGNPNYKDKDSDGDFIPDSVEYDPDAPATESTNADGDWYFKDYDSSPSDEHASPLSVSGTTVFVVERDQTTFTNDITYDGSEEWATENKNPDDGSAPKHVPPQAISVSKTLSKAKQSSPYESLSFVDRLSQSDDYSITKSTLRYSAPDIGDTSKSATATVSAGGDSGTTDITVQVNGISADILSGPTSLQEDEQGTFTVEVTDADGDVPADKFMPSVTADPGDHGEIVGSKTKDPGSDGRVSFTYEAAVDDSVFNSKDDSADTAVSFSTDGTTRSKTVTINSHPALEFKSTPSTQTVDAGSETTLTVAVQNEYGETPGQSHSVSASVSSDDSNTGNLDTNSISVNGKNSVSFTYTAPNRGTTDTVTYTLEGKEASTTINVNEPKLVIDSVSPDSPTLDADTSQTIDVDVETEFGDTPQQSASVSASFDGPASGNLNTTSQSVNGEDSVAFKYSAPRDGVSDTISFSLDGSSKSISITVREPDLSITSVSPSSTTINPGTSKTITVSVENEFGTTPHQSASVSASVSGSGSIADSDNKKSVRGKNSVSFTYNAPQDSASDTVDFSLDGSTKSTTITVGEPDLSITSVSPSSTTFDPGTSNTITVSVENEFGTTPHQSASVSASLGDSASGSIADSDNKKSVNGKDSVSFTYNAPQDSASDTIRFSLDSSSKSTSITVREPDLSITSVSPTPSSVTATQPNNITVSVENEFGNTPHQQAKVTARVSGTGTLDTTSKSIDGKDTVTFTYTASKERDTDTLTFNLDGAKESFDISTEVGVEVTDISKGGQWDDTVDLNMGEVSNTYGPSDEVYVSLDGRGAATYVGPNEYAGLWYGYSRRGTTFHIDIYHTSSRDKKLLDCSVYQHSWWSTGSHSCSQP